MRLVLDTNVAVSALLWNGPPFQLVQAARNSDVVFFSSVPLVDEFARVISREKFARNVAKSEFTPWQLLDRYTNMVLMVEPSAIPPTILEDPDDDQVLACAVGAKADAIVTGDAHLLKLGAFQGIPIMTVVHALERIELNRAQKE